MRNKGLTIRDGFWFLLSLGALVSAGMNLQSNDADGVLWSLLAAILCFCLSV